MRQPDAIEREARRGGMFGGMWLLWLLILVLVVFGIIALAKFMFGGRPRS